jgi:hypothetical protein
MPLARTLRFDAMHVARTLWTLVAIAAVGWAGCSSKDDEEADDHDVESPSCDAIMDVCHKADRGSGPQHVCHELAHEDVEADCAAQMTSCIQICEAVLDAGRD